MSASIPDTIISLAFMSLCYGSEHRALTGSEVLSSVAFLMNELILSGIFQNDFPTKSNFDFQIVLLSFQFIHIEPKILSEFVCPK